MQAVSRLASPWSRSSRRPALTDNSMVGLIGWSRVISQSRAA
jgi:hypothetical protein